MNARNRANAQKIASDLFDGFPWCETPQGNDYWNEVFENLSDLSKEPSPDDPPTFECLYDQPAVSSGTAYRCVDCSLMRCAAPDNRCPECDANINGGKVK